MTTRWQKMLIPLGLVVATATLYLPGLGTAPIYLMPDEVTVGIEAHSIATTGRDAFHGRFMPLYFEFNRLIVDHWDHRGIRDSWLPPAIFYSVALVLKALPLSERTIRLPTAIVGIVSVVLLYFVARRLFKNDVLAALAALLLALTPSHFIHSRLAADYLFPVPFMLGWLLCLLIYLDDARERTLFFATLCLGVGLYSYAASMLVMPLYLLITFGTLLKEKQPARACAVAVLGFLLPASLCIPWLLRHPDMISAVITKYDLNDAGRLTPLQGLRALFTYHRLGDQISLYWAFFNPRFLFFDGPMELMYSTREVGVFLLPVAVLLLSGLFAAIRGRFTSPIVLVLAGFATAPLAATVVNINDAIYRALEMLPFVALLATLGARHVWYGEWPKPSRRAFVVAGSASLLAGALWAARIVMTESRMPGAAVPLMGLGAIIIVLGMVAHRMRSGQIIVAGLLALVPLQFVPFYIDYFTNYPIRTQFIFSGNIRGALEKALEEDTKAHAPAIYLGEIASASMGSQYWKFYAVARHRQDVLDRTIDGKLFYPDQVLALPAGSLVVTNAGDGRVDALVDGYVAAGKFTKSVITEPDGTVSFMVLRRTAGS